MSTRDYPRPFELDNLDTAPLSRTYYDDALEPTPRRTAWQARLFNWHKGLSKTYEIQPSYEPVKSFTTRKPTWRTRFSGWRGGMVACIAITSLVLMLNLVLVAITATAWKSEDGLATAFEGDCIAAGRWTTATHLVINLLSSLLLGASNFAMQRLVAPSRQEIDRAHAKRKYMDIGMPSMRNLFLISKSRATLWVLLAMSSVPLHFVYNSVMFETVSTNYVELYLVDPQFFTQKDSWRILENHVVGFDASTDNKYTRVQNMLLDDKYLDKTLFENVTGADCAPRYASAFITSGYGFFVPTLEYRNEYGLNASHSLGNYVQGFENVLHASSPGQPLDISYCLIQIVPQKCQIQFSQSILYVVIACNVAKVCLMVIILWRLNQETVVTVGDAIKSFLQIPDPTTDDCCLMSKRTFEKVWEVPEVRSDQRFRPKHKETWYGACSDRRWGVSIFLYVATIVAAGLLFGSSGGMCSSVNGCAKNAFGRVNPNSIMSLDLPYGDTSVVPYVLLANLPQAIISLLYLTYNGLFTCMLANREWTQFSVKRAPLRVTLPSPGQRSTYFLQLPYTFSVPLMIASVLLHWFVSQSIFLARIALYKDGKMMEFSTGNYLYHDSRTETSKGQVWTNIGYSNTAILTSIIWGSALVVLGLAIAILCNYPEGCLVGGTNSAVISAACHVRYSEEPSKTVEEDITDRPLKWGVTIEGSRERVGHCCFSSGEVKSPKVGHLYAGVWQRKPRPVTLAS